MAQFFVHLTPEHTALGRARDDAGSVRTTNHYIAGNKTAATRA